MRLKKTTRGGTVQLNRVFIWRDSVAAGDDCDAPHEIVVRINAGDRLGAIVSHLNSLRYLPRIQGGEATWILEGRRPLAVLAQQWSSPVWLEQPSARIEDVARVGGRPDLHVRYWCQVDPQVVYERLRDGQPLPDMYGRSG